MTRAVYTLVLRLLAPLLWLWMSLRARKAGGDWEIFSLARFGCYRSERTGGSDHERVWVHAVSLGETRAAQPLIHALLNSGARVLLTHTTATGRAEGQRLFAEAIADGRLVQTWLPYDFPGSVRRFLCHFMPKVGLLVEREVWPNLLHQARRHSIPMTLVSARLSEGSAGRSRWLHRALRQAYGSLDLVLAQTPVDARRLVDAGARDVRVVGNMKFDLAIPRAQIEAGRAWHTALGRPVIAIASTREGEDALFADLIASLGKRAGNVLFLLIPRHPQRFNDAVIILRQRGLAHERRTAIGDRPPIPETRVLLGDTLGEMPFFYAAADVSIIGGGFVPLGGQNLIEACSVGTAVIVGPHMYNFAQATHDAVQAGAALQVMDAESALRTSLALVRDDNRRHAMLTAANQWMSMHAGATGRMMTALAPWLPR